jgi:hypothetical protein
MRPTPEDISLKKKLYLITSIAFAAIYAHCCFVISPLYASVISDVAYASGALPTLLSYFSNILTVLAISISYAVIILGKYRFGVKSFRGGAVIFIVATAAKYTANMLMSWISEKSIPLSWLWDILDVLFYTALECLQLLIFVLIVNKVLGDYTERKTLLNKANKALGNDVAESDPFVFTRIYDKSNCLQRCALVSALVVLVSKVSGSLINDIWMIVIGGFPKESITVIMMLVTYLSSIIFGVICYIAVTVAVQYIANRYW